MRILIYTFEFLPFSGGIATYCHELASGLTTNGHDVTVVAPEPVGSELKQLPYGVVWIARSRGRVALMVNGVRVLRGVVREIHPQVILATNQYAIISLALLGARLRVRCVPIIHGSEVLKHSNSQTMFRRILAGRMRGFYSRVSAIVCVSDFARTLFLSRFQVRRGLVLVVHNGMKDEFQPQVDTGVQVRERWGIPDEATILLTLARLVPRKGQDTVIRALPRIIEERPDVIYVVAGEGPYERTLSELALELGVQDHVVFAGRVAEADKYSYYAACDLFVMVSRQHGETVEGFGLSFLEAWHASTAVLGGRHGGVVEVIEDGVDGAMVDPHSVDAVVEEILRLVHDPARLREMGLRGKEKARTRFSDTAMAHLVIEGLSVVKRAT